MIRVEPHAELFDALSSQAPDAAAAAELETAAARFRRAGLRFKAGYVTERAAQRAVGSPRRIFDLVQTALADYALCWEPQAANTPEALAALKRSADLYRHWIWPRDDDRIQVRANELLLELAGRLVSASTDTPNRAGYLVRGFVIDAPLTGDWRLGIQPEAVDGSSASAAARTIVPSAFHCYLRLADYIGAQRVVEQCPELFDSPSLLGWKAVVRAHVWPDSAVDAFEEAADHFQSDSLEEAGGWPSYFRALSLLGAAREDPSRVVDHLQKASEILSTPNNGSLPREISQLAAVLRALSSVAAGGTPSVHAARQELLGEASPGAEDGEDTTLGALAGLVAASLEPFAVDPVQEMSSGRLVPAMEALRRLSHVLESDDSQQVHPAINLNAHDMPLLQIRTGLHTAVAEVLSQDRFERLLFTILQAWAPVHADVVHGPVRVGRNVVLLVRQHGRLVLRTYRATAREAGISDWSELRSELEELFKVPVEGLRLTFGSVRRYGTLVLNCRLTDDVRAEVAAWAGHQRRAFGPEADVMDLDDCVDWIVRDRLVNDLRAALAEAGS